MSSIPAAPPFRVCLDCISMDACKAQRVCIFGEQYPEVYGPDPNAVIPLSGGARRRPDASGSDR